MTALDMGKFPRISTYRGEEQDVELARVDGIVYVEAGPLRGGGIVAEGRRVWVEGLTLPLPEGIGDNSFSWRGISN